MIENETVSIIIPARNEIYLEKTIDNILENAEGDIEILVMLDGWRPDPEIQGKPRVSYHYFDELVGHRKALNWGAKIAKGKYIFKIDAHCAVDKGFDTKLKADCEYDWTIVPRMYNLDIETWKPKLFENTKKAIKMGKLHDYMYIGINGKDELRTLYYTGDLNKEVHKSPKMIDETMSFVGAAFFMHKDRYWELGGSDETTGGWGQQGVEISLKSWLSGGKLMVNKNTWFAHWFRASAGGFPYRITQRDINKARKYSKDLWLNNKWMGQTKPLEWLMEKFKPPRVRDFYKAQEISGYKKFIVDEFHKMFFKQWNIYTRRWQGVKIVKYPTDLFIYQTLIYENKPDIIIETGSYMGGGALFFANMCDIVGHGKVISVDKREIKRPEHKRIKYLIGRGTSTETMKELKKITKNKTVMVILDSDHTRAHVKRELTHYGPLVTKGQYLIVEDTMLNHPIPSKRFKNGPHDAVEWFMKRTKDFKIEHLEKQFLISMCPNGFLKKVR